MTIYDMIYWEKIMMIYDNMVSMVYNLWENMNY